MTSNKNSGDFFPSLHQGILRTSGPCHFPDNLSQALQKRFECFVLLSLHIVSDCIGTQLACKHLSTSSQQWSILFICIDLNFLGRETEYFPFYVFFVLLLYDLCCHMRMSVQRNQTDEKWATYYTIFLGLWIAYQTWGWSFHIFLTRWRGV